MASFLLLNGPNLNLLGTRQPEIYGFDTLSDIEAMVARHADASGHTVTAVQSNHEGELIDALHAAREMHQGVILNAGAYTHTSVAIRDAIAAIELPVVEVHMTNIHARESFRHQSMISAVCIGHIAGFGRRSYIMALDGLMARLEVRS